MTKGNDQNTTQSYQTNCFGVSQSQAGKKNLQAYTEDMPPFEGATQKPWSHRFCTRADVDSHFL